MIDASPLRRALVDRGALAAVLVFAISLQAGYLFLNTTPQHWDPSNHTMHAMRVARNIMDSPVAGLYRAAVSDYVYYPPGYYLTTAPAFMLFGFTISVALAWQVVYLVLTLVTIGALARLLAGEGWGAVAALTYLCFPIVLGLSRMAYIENLLALQTVLFAYLLFRDRHFTSFASAFGAGCVFGWGQLTKWQFVALAGPLVLGLTVRHLVHLRQKKAARGEWQRFALWLAIAAVTGFAVAAPWYLQHFPQILKDVQRNAYVVVMGNRPSTEIPSMLYYLQAFPWQLIGLPISLILGVSFVGVVAHRKKSRDGSLIALSVLASIAVVSVATHKQGRFIMPLLPLCALVLVLFLRELPGRARTLVVATLLSFSALNCVTQTVDASTVIPEASVPVGFGRRGYIVRYGTPEWLLPTLSRHNWALDEIMAEIRRWSEREHVLPTVAWRLEGDHLFYNSNTVYSYVFAYAKKGRVFKKSNFWICRMKPEAYFKEGEVVEQRKLHVIRSWILPDGSDVRLYRGYPELPPPGLPFVLGHDADELYFQGFSDAEREFRWSDGKEASLELPIFETPVDVVRYTGVMTLSGNGAQEVGLSLNGHELGNYLVGSEVLEIRFAVAAELLSLQNPSALQLSLPRAARSAGEMRTLGVAFRELRLRPE